MQLGVASWVILSFVVSYFDVIGDAEGLALALATAIGPVLQVIVFLRLLQRFRARLRHLSLLQTTA